MKIAVIGSINMDYTLIVNSLPQKGETLSASKFHVAPGGKGANQAVAARRLGGEVYMIGCLGSDNMGDELIGRLRKDGIDVSAMKRADIPTGNAMITVDKNGDNTIIVYPGSNYEIDPKWIEKHEDIIKLCDYIMLQLEIPMETVEMAIKTAGKHGRKVILNPAPAKVIDEKLYSFIDIITPNETELEVLTGTSDVEEGSKILLQRGVKNVVVTLGDKGSAFTDSEGTVYMKSCKVNAVDTTAAGDTFNGAFAVALSEGKSIKEALSFANAAGALSTLKLGAQEAIPSREEVDTFLSGR